MEKISPYQGLEPRAFWKTHAEGPYPPEGLYRPKWRLRPADRIVTAGSCFAQHVGRALGQAGYNVLDGEPLPIGLAPERAADFGYGLYSARYGNIYTTRQLRQLLEEAWEGAPVFDAVWEKAGRFHDALRPNVEPQGLESAEEVRRARAGHLAALRETFAQADVFIFTLGLTEAWVHKPSGQVYPTAPGTVAGRFDPEIHGFMNFRAAEVRADLVAALSRLRTLNPALRVLLTVSPVPLTATASGAHVLCASTWSKAVLRAVAGEMAEDFPEVDYFPSYEIVTSSKAEGFFEPNLRQVTAEGVARVMQVFTAAQDEEAPVDKPRKRSEEERAARKAERKARKG
jgi:hypothetical protein